MLITFEQHVRFSKIIYWRIPRIKSSSPHPMTSISAILNFMQKSKMFSQATKFFQSSSTLAQMFFRLTLTKVIVWIFDFWNCSSVTANPDSWWGLRTRQEVICKQRFHVSKPILAHGLGNPFLGSTKKCVSFYSLLLTKGLTLLGFCMMEFISLLGKWYNSLAESIKANLSNS